MWRLLRRSRAGRGVEVAGPDVSQRGGDAAGELVAAEVERVEAGESAEGGWNGAGQAVVGQVEVGHGCEGAEVGDCAGYLVGGEVEAAEVGEGAEVGERAVSWFVPRSSTLARVRALRSGSLPVRLLFERRTSPTRPVLSRVTPCQVESGWAESQFRLRLQLGPPVAL